MSGELPSLQLRASNIPTSDRFTVMFLLTRFPVGSNRSRVPNGILPAFVQLYFRSSSSHPRRKVRTHAPQSMRAQKLRLRWMSQ